MVECLLLCLLLEAWYSSSCILSTSIYQAPTICPAVLGAGKTVVNTRSSPLLVELMSKGKTVGGPLVHLQRDHFLEHTGFIYPESSRWDGMVRTMVSVHSTWRSLQHSTRWSLILGSDLLTWWPQSQAEGQGRPEFTWPVILPPRAGTPRAWLFFLAHPASEGLPEVIRLPLSVSHPWDPDVSSAQG